MTDKQTGPGLMAALLTCSMLILMGGAAVTPGLPGLEARFSDNADLASFIITLPHLAVAIVGFLMGMLSDRMGKRRVLISSLLIFIISGAGAYFLDNLYAILVLRFLLGFGIAGIVCTVTSLIGCYYTGESRVRMLGLQSAAMGIGVLILELVGGVLADISWNAPFLVYLIAVPFLILVLRYVWEPDDVVEMTDMTVSNEGSDMKLLVGCYITIFIGMIIIFVVPTRMPSYMETTMGVSATLMGLFLGFHGLGNALFSCLHRKISRRVKSMHMVSLAFLLLAVALLLPLTVGGNVPVCLASLIISGFAVGLMIPSIVNSIVSGSTGANRGKMMGIYAVALNMGQFAVSIITIPVFSAVGSSYPDMLAVFGIAALVMAVAVMLLFGFRKNGAAKAA